MATNASSISLNRNEPFTTGSLWRLASWGAGAALALSIAVGAAFSESGTRRLVLALSSDLPTRAARANSREAPRAADAALAESVRLLAAERDRLATRVDQIERHLDDLTGSITASQRTVQSGLAPSRSEGTAQSASEPGQGSPARAIEASPVVESGLQASSTNELPKGEYGADIGSAMSFEGLRTLWSSTKASNPDVFKNLYPLVSVQESSRTRAPQLRLIVGPFADWQGAGRFCAALAGARLACQPTAFDGQVWPMQRGRLNATCCSSRRLETGAVATAALVRPILR
jgi:hypothetical protein